MFQKRVCEVHEQHHSQLKEKVSNYELSYSTYCIYETFTFSAELTAWKCFRRYSRKETVKMHPVCEPYNSFNSAT